jgi:hypothetical protein
MKKKLENISSFLFCPLSPTQRPINDYIDLKDNFKDNLKFQKEKNFWFFFLFENFKKMIFFSYFPLKELEKNLENANIIYEESSWYDTQIWQKEFFILKNDRLLNLLIIQPILKQNFLFVFSFFLFSLFLILFYFFDG